MLDATKTGSGGSSRLNMYVLVKEMARRIKSLRDAEDVVTLLLQVLVIRGRRSAREGQVHILRFSPTTTTSKYRCFVTIMVPLMLCRASLLLLSRSTAAAVAASAGRNRPARPIAGAVVHCCSVAVAALVPVAFKLLHGGCLCSSPARCRVAIRCCRPLAGHICDGQHRPLAHATTAQPLHAASIAQA